MIKVIAKNAPDFTILASLTVCLALLFGLNWFMADVRGEGIVKYSGECVVGEYNTETNTGSLTCGEYVKNDGSGVINGFIGKVYIQKLPVSCEITENEYSGDVDWDCQEMLSENDS